MTTYELPDGFEGMETCPYTDDKEVFINVLYINGRINPIEQWRIHNTPNRDRIGWSPVVPPKKKRRFVVKERSDCFGPVGVWDERGNWVATEIPTRESAQAVADIYEQAYEGGV